MCVRSDGWLIPYTAPIRGLHNSNHVTTFAGPLLQSTSADVLSKTFCYQAPHHPMSIFLNNIPTSHSIVQNILETLQNNSKPEIDFKAMLQIGLKQNSADSG